MAKKSKKLALKKESLRNLSSEELGQVAGGTNYAYMDWNRFVYKMPVIGTTSRTDSGQLYYLGY